jgi:hypothetical protein
MINFHSPTNKTRSYRMKNFFGVKSLLIAVMIAAGINGCKDEDNPAKPPVHDEHAPPTTMIVVLKETGKSDSTKSLVRDSSVVKGKPMVEDTLRVQSGKSYTGYIMLWNESVTPVEDATHEIEEEKDEHLFLFTATGGANGRLTISNLDKDSQGRDFGLNFSAAVSGTGAATGGLRIQLRHYGTEPKTGTTFDTDIDQTFPVKIQ